MGKSFRDDPDACGIILNWSKRHPELDIRIDNLLVSINDRLKILNPEAGMDIEPLAGEIFNDYLYAIVREAKAIDNGANETGSSVERRDVDYPSDWEAQFGDFDAQPDFEQNGF